MSRTLFLKIIFLPIVFLLVTENNYAQVPILNSLPSSSYVIYLDFDGEVVIDFGWNSGNEIDALPSGLSDSKIIEVFKRVSEKYRPFNINVTTDVSVYDAASSSKKGRAIITTSKDWYPDQAGGVAFVGSFGSFDQSPCWIFSSALSYSPEYIADAASHEIGHTLGLYHHGRFYSSCALRDPYHPGNSPTGQTSWGPIMGAPYGKNIVSWYQGATDGSTCTSNPIQNDLSVITSSQNGFGYRADDIGNTNATSKALSIISSAFADSGIIERNTDVDMFKLSLTQEANITVNARPFSVNTASNTGATLDIKLSVYDGNQLIAFDSSITKLNASLTLKNLAAGSYYIKIDGHGISNYSDYGGTGPLDYGSLGQYYLSGTVDLIFHLPPVAAFTLSTSHTCVGNPVTLTDASTYTPTSWKWICHGATPDSIADQNATFNFNSTGTYSVLLTASNTYGTDTSLRTIIVDPAVTISVSHDTLICRGQPVTLFASGATDYTWQPATGIASGNTYAVSPVSSTTYTVTGTNDEGCTAKAAVSVKFLASPGSPVISMHTVTLTIGGQTGTTYQWYRQGVLVPGATGTTYSPSVNGNYTVMATNSIGCTSTSTPYNFVSAGVENITGTNIKMFPNPADDWLTINIEDHSINDIRIFDLTGRIVFNEKDFLEIVKVDVSAFPQGTYLIELSGSGSILYGKIVILH